MASSVKDDQCSNAKAGNVKVNNGRSSPKTLSSKR